MYNRAKELDCDVTIFVFWFFIIYLPKKMETKNWPKAADSPLRVTEFNQKNNVVFKYFDSIPSTRKHHSDCKQAFLANVQSGAKNMYFFSKN